MMVTKWLHQWLPDNFLEILQRRIFVDFSFGIFQKLKFFAAVAPPIFTKNCLSTPVKSSALGILYKITDNRQ